MPVDTRLAGIYAALITPLEPDGETVDLDALGQVIDYVIEGGSTGFVALGGTGEFAQLSQRERERATHAAVERAAGRVPVVIGIVTPGLGDAKHYAGTAKAAGADYIMPVTPYYVPSTQEGMVEWYEELATAVDIPIILYNIPAKTGINLEPESVAHLASSIDTIVGIKECTPNMMQYAELQRLAGDKLSILAGEDFYALAELLQGARGGILASANLIPRHWARLYQATQEGRFTDARALFDEIEPLLAAIFSEPNPGPLKAAMEMVGLKAGPVVKPLREPSAELRQRLIDAMANVGIQAPVK